LQKTSAGDRSSEVVIIYSGQLDVRLGLWTRVRPPAPQILSSVPVSRTLWTVFLPQEYAVSLVTGESNLEEVTEAFQEEERKLSFLDELRQIVQVASSKTRSAAQTTALNNLKELSAKVSGYAQESTRTDAANALLVRDQAQQIAANLKGLTETKPEGRPVEGEGYFSHLEMQQEGERTREGVDLDRLEQRRGDLRRQAAEQLEKLKMVQPAEREKAPSPQPRPGVGGAPVAAAPGGLSLDLGLAPTGAAHHFRKLHGEPRLVLRACHENLTRELLAVVWVGLCLGFATAVILGVRRSAARGRAYRGWPWLAAVAGTTWLFLLPWGIGGFALLVTALCVLAARLRKPPTRIPEMPHVEAGTS
jgi:hypothetical protein